MSKIKFKADEKKIYDGDFSQIGRNQVRLIFHDEIPDSEVLLSGFNLVNEYNGVVQTPREDYIYLYRTYEDEPNKVELCNDNIQWVEPPKPEPLPEPEPYVPTLEEVQEAKVAEMEAVNQAVTDAGIDVVLEDGTAEHFTLTSDDKIYLLALQSDVEAGKEELPWSTADESEHCKNYSNADMKKIISAAKEFAAWHKTYFKDLRIYIRSLDSKEAVEAVTYGMEIPEAYRSDPLKAMMADKAS